MARRIGYLLITLALLCGRISAALDEEVNAVGDYTAQSTASSEPSKSPAAKDGDGKNARARNLLPEDPEERRKALEAMPPEQRERLRKNFERWKRLPDDRKNDMRDLHEERAERIQQEIDETLDELGLNLNEKQKREFARRYFAGRKRIEEALRQEMDRKRAKQIERLRDRLAREFGDKKKPESAPKKQE